MKKLLKVVNSLLFVFFVCFIVYILISSKNIKLTKLLITLCILPLIMLPFILDKIKVYHMDEVLIFFYYFFLLLAMVMGSILNFYYKIWWFDLFTHFISGILTSIVAFILLQESKLVNKQYKWFGFLFIIVFTTSIAAGWEYFEFFCDKVFHEDAQWVAKTGVDDTMTDMLIATFGGILVSIYYLFYIRKKNNEGSVSYGKKRKKSENKIKKRLE